MSHLTGRVATPVFDTSYWTPPLPRRADIDERQRMAVIGVRDVVAAIVRYKDEVTDNDGGLWVVMMNGLLIIPVAMAALFYPMMALLGFGVALLLGVATVVGTHEYQRRQSRQVTRDGASGRGLPLDRRRGSGAASGLLAIFAMTGTMHAADDPGVASYRVANAEVTIVCPLTVGGSFEAKTKDVRGEVATRADQPGAIDGALHVNLQTLATGIGLRDRHMRENYLEVQKGPEYATAVLEQIRVERLEGTTTLKGVLLLHGQRREVSGTAAIKEQDGRIRVQAQFALKVSDFEIPKPSYLGVGVRDEIQIKVTMTVMPGAVTQTASAR